jgi:hypothetical protein
MNETWRFIIVVALLVVIGSLLPFVADAAAGQAGGGIQHSH